MAAITSCRLTVPAIIDHDGSIAGTTTDGGSDVAETLSVDLSDENTETESVCAPTLCNTPTSEIVEREVRCLYVVVEF